MSFHMTVNGKRIEANQGDMVLAACRRAGIPIPTLCHHEAVEPFGSCRLCMVEVSKPAWKGWKSLMTACLYPAAPDLVVETNSEPVREVRRTVLDLLLARCPDSRLIQELAHEYGIEQTSFKQRESPDLCILCGLCVRICEAAATAAIATVRRGHGREIGPPFGGPPPDCIGCLACYHICPTGHIQYKESGYTRSIWGRDLELAACETCRQPLPITKEQAAFLSERQKLDASYFAKCEDCQRRQTSNTMGRLARWNQLGMVCETGQQEGGKP